MSETTSDPPVVPATTPLEEHSEGDQIATAELQGCAVDDCDSAAVMRQAVQAPDGTLVSLPLCGQHYGLRDVMTHE